VTAIRPMTAADLDAVMRLDVATPEAPHWTHAAYKAFLAPESSAKQIFVAENNGAILGFIAGQIIAGTCELQSIAVSASARRHGIGRTLLATLTEWSQKHNAARVELEVRAGNIAAISFYERLEFRKDGLRRGYYRNPDDDALLMSLDLKYEPEA
jgi:[ribosomal protein S18]-alanine N-acetyltransferase